MVFLFIALAFAMTLFGGLIGMRFRDRSHLILGASAGIILGIVAFDLIPEAIIAASTTGLEAWVAMAGLVFGFLFIHILERSILIHHAHEDEYAAHSHPSVGKAQALALIGHSFFDGLAIGLGFHVSTTVGVSVAIAVLAHDFCDGLNTVSFMLRHGNSRKQTLMFLVGDALAPLLGGLLASLIVVPAGIMPIILGWFAGVLLYIAAADVLPEAHAKHSSLKTVAMTVIGALVSFGITRFLGE